MRRRLLGEIQNLTNQPVQASTNTAEVHDVIVKPAEESVQGGTSTEQYDAIVKPCEDKTTTSATVITKLEWSSVKALFGNKTSTHEADLDEELRLLYQFVYAAVPSNESRSPVPNAVIEKEAHEEVIVETDTVPSPVPVESPKAGPNASISTLQNVSLVREHGLSAEQMEEIEEAFEAFDKVLRTGGRKQLKVLLEGTILINMVDTGGHSAFLEMLPALTMGPALYLIFFRLNQELKSTYQIQYVSENNEIIQVGESSYTVEEVIFQALSSIACFSCTEPIKKMPNLSHAAMLMGTHKDRLGSNSETVKNEIETKDATLQTSLREILETDIFDPGKNFLHYASDDDSQLMFTIDNMTGDDRELKEVRKRLEEIIKQEFDKFPIPASWLMFNIFLRKMGKRTMSLLQCQEIGKRLKVTDTNEALWFLHHCVGTLMHFPDIEEIKDVVICDPQVVFDSITDLILNSFNLKQVRGAVCDHLKKTGQFSFKHIQKIAKNSKSDHLPLPKLVKLLEHLNIIAPIRPECHCSNPQSDEVFFMPAVLQHATEEELHVEQSAADPVPLMICFKGGYVPVGVFCAMIARLVAQEDTLGWRVLKPKYLYKNRATFRINGAYNVTLISKPKWYEIYIARISTTSGALEKMCQRVLKTVCDTLDQVLSKMRYKQYSTSSPSDPTPYMLGFKCPEHPDDDHLVIQRSLSGEEAQPAKSLWLSYPKENSKSTMICLKVEQAIDLRDIKFSPPNLFPTFADRSLVWFGEVSQL